LKEEKKKRKGVKKKKRNKKEEKEEGKESFHGCGNSCVCVFYWFVVIECVVLDFI